MHSPCTMRRAVKVARSGAVARSAVGIDSTARATKIPSRRSMCRLKKATARPATAIPIVAALTAKPIAAGLTL